MDNITENKIQDLKTTTNQRAKGNTSVTTNDAPTSSDLGNQAAINTKSSGSDKAPTDLSQDSTAGSKSVGVDKSPSSDKPAAVPKEAPPQPQLGEKYETDRAAFQAWRDAQISDESDKLHLKGFIEMFKAANHKGESVSGDDLDKVGSIYFGGTSKEEIIAEKEAEAESSKASTSPTAADKPKPKYTVKPEDKSKSKSGGRIRLIHAHGPALSMYDHIYREEQGDHLTEEMWNEKEKSKAAHKSRGIMKNTLDGKLDDEKIKDLIYAVAFAEDKIKKASQAEKDKYDKSLKSLLNAKKAAETTVRKKIALEKEKSMNAKQAYHHKMAELAIPWNNFLKAYIKENKLDIDLNEEDFIEKAGYYTEPVAPRSAVPSTPANPCTPANPSAPANPPTPANPATQPTTEALNEKETE